MRTLEQRQILLWDEFDLGGLDHSPETMEREMLKVPEFMEIGGSQERLSEREIMGIFENH